MNDREINIKSDQLWRMHDRATQKFENITEARVKIIKVGKIEGQDLDGVEFRFTNSEEHYFMPKQEFFESFEKIY
jgi:hypothetical protein